MIVSLHVATGALGGALVRSRLGAFGLGLVLHAAGDHVRHQDFRSRRFELGSGLAGIALLALVRGPLDPAVAGAVAASSPDLEHILPFPRPGGRKLFPSHRVPGWHRAGGISAPAQLVLAGLLLGALVSPGRPSWLR